VQHLASAHDIVQGFQGFLDRGGRIESVNLVEIDVIHLQPVKAGVNRVSDVLAGESTLVGVVTHHAEDLGGNDQALARRPKLFEGAAQDLFADAKRIDIGSIKEVNASFDGLADERPALLLFEHPRAPFPGTVGHAAQANPRDLYPRRTQIYVFHG